MFPQLSSGSRDEEPLVNAWVNWCWGEVLVLRDRWKLIRGDTAWGLLDGKVGSGDFTGGSLSSDELLPSLSTLTNDIGSVLLVLALAGESELVLWLSVWDFVDSEPLIGSSQKTWQVSLDILNIIELRSQWVVDIDDDNLPVSLLLIKKSHDTKDLDLLDLTRVSDQLTDLADIQWIVVTLGLGLGVDDVGVLPCLREGAIVPEVTLVGEAVADETELALLDVLLDGVEQVCLANLHLCVGPSWDLDDHVQDSLLLIGVKRNIVEGRDWDAILLNVDAVLQSVWCSDLAGGVLRGHICVRGRIIVRWRRRGR